ncbi:MAG: hypothetical protein KUG69_14045 [Marinosulfonomonas sp.]|nr:hypothetical protein [Marinosulfonomonas sp.]
MIAMAVATSALAGCAADPQAAAVPQYDGYTALIIDDGLINFLVTMRGIESREQIADYAECVAAGYALERGNGFARHVRTNVAKEAGIWRADAVYTISPTLPQGLRTLDAEVVVQNCAADAIPTD